MIYFNYAATSYPKPSCVTDAYVSSVNALPSAQFRSAGIFDNSDLFAQTKMRLGELFGAKNSGNFYFASGSTDALNRIIFGLSLEADEFMTTATEHNSVLRPLYNLADYNSERGALSPSCFTEHRNDKETQVVSSLSDRQDNKETCFSGHFVEKKVPIIVPCDENGLITVESVQNHLTKRTKALIVNHCSNVTGAIQDLRAIGKFAKEHGLFFIVDASQSAGCVEIKIDEWGIDALAFTGHKSLFSVQGTGGYYVRKGFTLKPLLYGGTGKDSMRICYTPDTYEYEVGTQNSHGIAALNRACEYILDKKVSAIYEKEQEIGAYLVKELSEIAHLHLYGKGLKERGPVVSLGIDGMKPADIAYILQSSYNMITRAGYQCAPLIHAYLGSEDGGTLRLSYSFLTTKEELDEAVSALKEIAQAAN